MAVTNLYLALGDSITTGYGVGGNHCFASLYYATLCTRFPSLRYYNFGINGLSSGGLASILKNNYQLRSLLSKAGIISITIGSNDLFGLSDKGLSGGQIDFSSMSRMMINNLECIGGQIRYLSPRVIVLVANIYNPLPGGPYQQYSSQAQVMIEQANTILFHWAKKYCFGLVRIDRVFRGKETLMLGSDCLHPSLYGHQIIASEFSRDWLPTPARLMCMN